MRAPKQEKLRILTLGADRAGTEDEGNYGLRLGRQQLRIRKAIQMATHRDLIEFETRPAATVDDLLDGITAFRPHVVHFSAHRQPIDDLAARTGALVEHHERRLDDLYAAFGDEELTLWQAAERMTWYRPWDQTPPTGKQMALSEASAHVRHLIERGRARRVPGTDPARFARV